jgi:mevalonate kinase
MLFGEYAVLEGHPALAMCLDRRIACEVEAVPGGDAIQLRSDAAFAAPIEVPLALLDEAAAPRAELSLLWPVLRAHAPRDAGLRLRFDAEFPPTWGLGSSSASTLAAAGALRALAGLDWQGRAVFAEVLAAQRQLQGAASGYDVATQLLGGFVAYEDAGEAQMRRVEPGAAEPLHWVVGWSRRKASTGEMIKQVRRSFPIGHEIYAEIGALARRGIDLLAAGDVRALGAALNEGQRLLHALGAVPSDLAELLATLQSVDGVLGARLSGAGGGDCVLILADDPAAAAQAAEALGLELLGLSPENGGIRQEDNQ